MDGGRERNGLLPLSVCFSMNEMACSWGKREKSEATCRVDIIKSKSAVRSVLWHTSWAYFCSSHFFLSFLNTEGMATLVQPLLKIHRELLIYGLIKSNKLLATAQVGCTKHIFLDFDCSKPLCRVLNAYCVHAFEVIVPSIVDKNSGAGASHQTYR